LACKQEKAETSVESNNGKLVEFKYAKGFSVQLFDTFKILTISDPWPKSERIYRMALIKEDHDEFNNNSEFDHVIQLPLHKIVVTSTTHIPALELLEVETKLVGFPGCDYISSEKTRKRIDNGEIRELGKNESINIEVLLELDPDLIIGFGVDGSDRSFETIQKSGIPVVYNGDWVESSALAKAEWIKFFAVLFNKEQQAETIFNEIEKNYLEAKQLAQQAKNRPTILSGAMYKDIWYLPNGTSPEAQFLKDANVNYLWSETTGSGSLSLSFETVFEKAQHADIWLSPSYYTSRDDLLSANEHYAKFDAFQNKNIFTFSNVTGNTGGVLYYELGIARPDIVLKDIIKICHPELLQDYNPYFFNPLE
jgi:iron complex transport system substrate-binding protein